MVGSRKRKHVAASDDTNKPTAPIQVGIKAFGTMSKVKSEGGGLKKRKTVHQRENTPPPQPHKQEKKRKRGAEPDEDEPSSTKDNIFKRFAAPHTKRPKNVQPPSPSALFDRLRLGPDARAIPLSFEPTQLPHTPPHTPEAERLQPGILPTELLDLFGLHAAFLSALSIYYSHNGTSSPVDVKSLLPMITKNWKKRTVTLDDLRRLFAVDMEHQPFKLQDFGRAGLCLTKTQPRGRATKRANSFVDEVDLNASFEEALLAIWSKWTQSSSNTISDASAFIGQLPLVEIAADNSVEKTAPLFARGHQRLAELKAGQAAAKREPTPTPEVQIQQKPLQNRGTNLLDRILAKQAHTASLPAGPTKDQLERKAALHRIEDIVRVLDLLAAGRARCSFSMQAIIQQLRQSLRNPISREEVERCLDLMAKEITPGFVGLVKNGAVTGVVVTKGGKVGLEELRARITAATA